MVKSCLYHTHNHSKMSTSRIHNNSNNSYFCTRKYLPLSHAKKGIISHLYTIPVTHQNRLFSIDFLYLYKLSPTQFKAILTESMGLYAHNNTLHSLSLCSKTGYHLVVKILPSDKGLYMVYNAILRSI